MDGEARRSSTGSFLGAAPARRAVRDKTRESLVSCVSHAFRKGVKTKYAHQMKDQVGRSSFGGRRQLRDWQEHDFTRTKINHVRKGEHKEIQTNRSSINLKLDRREEALKGLGL